MINILPYTHKKIIDRLRLLRTLIVTFWAFIILILAAALLLTPLLVAINSRYALADRQITELERAGIVIDPVDVAALESRAKILAEKLAAPLAPAPTRYISIVRRNLSGGITLSGFSMEQTSTLSLEIAGIASTREVLQRFIDTLERDPAIAKVESPVSNFVKSVSSPFSITVTFNK